MGNWQLEVARMALYLSFPVGLYHCFNHSEIFEKWALELHNEIDLPDDPKFREEIKKVAKELRERNEERLLKAMNEKQNK